MATLFTTQSPATPDETDAAAYEMGMLFQSAVAGYITAIRHYKAVSEVGTHTGRIWTAAGVQVASVAFKNETASGWQEQVLPAPLLIEADTTYVVTVNVNLFYPVTSSGLASSVVNGDLSSVEGSNGVFGTISTFPTSSFNDGNYFRDVVFAVPDIYTLRPSGGDYTTFQAALTALEATNWITTDKIPIIEFDQGTYDGVNKLVERLVIKLTNTDANHPLIIRPRDGHWHDGTFGSGLRIEDSWGYNAVVKVAKYVRIYGLEIVNTGSYGRALGEEVSEATPMFVGVGLLLDAPYRSTVVQTDNARFISCHFRGGGTGSTYSSKYYNCLSEGNSVGFLSIEYASLMSTWTNCVSYGNTLAYDDASEAKTGSTNNASSQYSIHGVPGANGYQANVVAGDFEDAANDDFSLSSGSNLDGAGADLSELLWTDWVDIKGLAFDAANAPIGPWPPALAGGTSFTGVGSGGDLEVTASVGTMTWGVDAGGLSGELELTGGTGSVAVGVDIVPDSRPNADAFTKIWDAEGTLSTGLNANGTTGTLDLSGETGALTVGADLAGGMGPLDIDGALGSVLAGDESNFVAVGSAGVLDLEAFSGTLARGHALTGQTMSVDVVASPGNLQTGAALSGETGALDIASTAGTVDSGTSAALNGQAGDLEIVDAAGGLQVGIALTGTAGVLDVVPKTGSLITIEATVTQDVTGAFSALGQSAPVLVSESALNVSVWDVGANTLVLERSFDDGANWRTVSDIADDVEQTHGEPEDNVLYRVRVTDYVSGSVSYRLGLPRPRVFCCGGLGTYFVADVGNLMN